MQNTTQLRVASVLTILLGAWVAISPAFISITGAALTNIIITGSVIALAGLIQLFTRSTSPSWLAGLAAVWLFISAFAFSVSNNAAWNMAISGIVAFLLATWDGVEVNTVERRHHAM